MAKNKPGQGRKSEYGEPTDTIAFRIPISKIEEVKQLITKLKEQWKKKN